MAKLTNYLYPEERDLRMFIEVLQEGDYPINKYLPRIDEKWYKVISECMDYVQQTSQYELDYTMHDAAARILYKIAKRHELEDGNKRSAVMGVFIFCLLNDHIMLSPQQVKYQAKRVAITKGRSNEEIMKKRVSNSLSSIIKPIR